MNETRCLCGHLRIHHLGIKGDRGKCPNITTYVFGKLPIGYDVPPTTKILNPKEDADVKIWNKILDGYRAGKKARVAKRGYAYLECPCPMFHLVDLGRIKLEIPKGGGGGQW